MADDFPRARQRTDRNGNAFWVGFQPWFYDPKWGGGSVHSGMMAEISCGNRGNFPKGSISVNVQ